MRPLVLDAASRMSEHMSNNDDAAAQAEYDALVARGVDLHQFSAARLQIGRAKANSDEMGAQWI